MLKLPLLNPRNLTRPATLTRIASARMKRGILMKKSESMIPARMSQEALNFGRLEPLLLQQQQLHAQQHNLDPPRRNHGTRT